MQLAFGRLKIILFIADSGELHDKTGIIRGFVAASFKRQTGLFPALQPGERQAFHKVQIRRLIGGAVGKLRGCIPLARVESALRRVEPRCIGKAFLRSRGGMERQ